MCSAVVVDAGETCKLEGGAAVRAGGAKIATSGATAAVGRGSAEGGQNARGSVNESPPYKKSADTDLGWGLKLSRIDGSHL